MSELGPFLPLPGGRKLQVCEGGALMLTGQHEPSTRTTYQSRQFIVVCWLTALVVVTGLGRACS